MRRRAGALDRLDGAAVVVGHSYGGQVISEAAAGRPDVIHLVYVCAFMCDVGQSPADVNQGSPPTWIEVVGDGLAAPVTTARETFFHDVDPQLASQAEERLQFQSLRAAATPSSAAAWQGIDSTYIICEHDQAIPVDQQRRMSKHASNTRTLNASHSPFLSMPDRVVDILTSVIHAAASPDQADGSLTAAH